jgi:hypothetical protein
LHQKRFGGCDELDGVGPTGVQFEGGLVDPYGVNRELDRLVYGFKDVDAKASGLTAGRLIYFENGFAELGFLAGMRGKADDEVEGHGIRLYGKIRRRIGRDRVRGKG